MDRSIDAGAPAPRRLVFYSWWSGPGGMSEAERWRLGTSVTSLRAHEPAIPVRLFLFGAALPPELGEVLAACGVTVEHLGDYEAALGKYSGAGAAEVLARLPQLAKFLALPRVAELDVDEALYLDTDTYVTRGVARLFGEYAALDLYAREEPHSRYSRLGPDPAHLDEAALAQLAAREGAGVPTVVNTGVMLLRRRALAAFAARMPAYLDDVLRLIAWMADHPDERDAEAARYLRAHRERLLLPEDAARALPYPSRNRWIVDQVAAWLTLARGRESLRCGLLLRRDVLMGGEGDGAGEATITHYFSVNTESFRARLGAGATAAAAARRDAAEVAASFARLGERVEAAWRETGYDEDAFPEVAEAALLAEEPRDHLDALDVMSWAAGPRALPRQVGVHHRFGHPVHVYTTERFYIEVIHWLDSTTTIHQHAFSGAFAVLAGSSVHARYRFEAERRHGPRVRTGRVVREHVELLAAGDVRRILAGAALAHSLFHLERPSVTVVVRSYGIPDALPQLVYLPPGLAYESQHPSDRVERQLQAFDVLARLGDARLEALIGAAYEEADACALVHLAYHGFERFAQADGFAKALARARPRHGALVDAIAAAVEERRRVALIHGLRRRLRGADHRFFLALLLHFDEARPILDLVRARHPDEAPEDRVVAWLEEITRASDPDAPGRRLFDYVLEGDARAVARHMMGTRSLDELLLRLGGEYDPEDVRARATELAVIDRALRGSRVFGALFR